MEYGTTASYGSRTTLDTSLATSHAATLAGLAAATTYHYRVLSRDAAGNLAASQDMMLTTAAAPDTAAPTISAVTAAGVGPTGATISWATNEAADTQVEYGPTTAYAGQQPGYQSDDRARRDSDGAGGGDALSLPREVRAMPLETWRSRPTLPSPPRGPGHDCSHRRCDHSARRDDGREREEVFTVTYADDTAVLASSIDGFDVVVTGPNGFTQLAKFLQ